MLFNVFIEKYLIQWNFGVYIRILVERPYRTEYEAQLILFYPL